MNVTATPPIATLDVSASHNLLRRVWMANRPLTLLGVAMIGSLVVALIGLATEPRVITGVPAWLKPMKFAFSTGIYAFTLVWLLGLIRGHRRLTGVISWVISVALAVEIALINLQVVRGTTSHFNVSSPFNTAVWDGMAMAIIVLFVLNLVVAVLLLRQQLPNPALAWGIRFGIALACCGMGVAFLMTTPTASQLAAAQAGQGLPVSGAHTVGAADGGAGLPIVGWSTVGGDLRIAHFVGLHALQILPLVGWWVSRRRTLSDNRRRALVAIAGTTYGALIALLAWQALRAQSIVHPDTLTLGVLGGIVGAAAAAMVVVLRVKRPSDPAYTPAPARVA